MCTEFPKIENTQSTNINIIYYIIKTNKHEHGCHESFMDQQDKIKVRLCLESLKRSLMTNEVLCLNILLSSS